VNFIEAQSIEPEDSWTLGGTCLAYQACTACGARWYFLRTLCPACGSRDPRTAASAGLGRVVAATTVHRAPADAFRPLVPYVLLLVDADEGFRLMAHGEPSLAIGDRVQGSLRTVAGSALPVFSACAGR
jgi:uncharacterized protein